MIARRQWLVALAFAALAGCSDEGQGGGADGSDAGADGPSDAADAAGSDAGDAADAEPPEAPFAELMAQGAGRYIGQFPPTEVRDGEAGRTHVFGYDVADGGPACLRGATYHVATRDTGSTDLLVFMQGGGACWSDFCFAIEEAGSDGVPTFDVLDPDSETNPFADWNVLYLPYCDGSLFAGDAEYDTNDDGEPDRVHRGLQNLTAALDVAASEFPEVERVMLAGSSGGGFGTIIATPLVRHLFPDAELLVFNDAGVGVVKRDDPSFVADLVEEFGASSLIPASCSDCLSDGHLISMVDYSLAQDPTIRVAAFSSYEDSVIAGIFLDLPRGEFEEELLARTGELSATYPGRYAAFLIEGTQHTVLLGDIQGFLGDGFDAEGNPFESIVQLGSLEDTFVGDVSAGTWLSWMLEGDPRWVPVADGVE